jgi:hypothetical protein
LFKELFGDQREKAREIAEELKQEYRNNGLEP